MKKLLISKYTTIFKPSCQAQSNHLQEHIK